MKNKTKAKISKFIVMLSLGVLALMTASQSTLFTNAGLGLCGGLGSGIGVIGDVDRDPVNASRPSRAWTVEELFGKSIRLTTYNGEGKETWLLAGTEERLEGVPGIEEVKETIMSPDIRNAEHCFANSILSAGLPNALFFIATSITKIARMAISLIFTKGLICGPNDTQGCFNLAGVVGGKGDGGLITSLTSSIYTPFVVIAFILVAVNVIYKGIMKGQLREALMDIVWSVLAFVVGFMFLLNPTMLARAPQVATSAISECLVGAVNGQNCLTSDGVQAPTAFVGPECLSDDPTNSLSCGIWKSFVLEPWAKAQFGRPYNELYTANVPEGGKLWEGADDNFNYCLALGSSGAADSYGDGPVEIGQGRQVCNVALYQLYLNSDLVETSNQGGRTHQNSKVDGIDMRWYDLIVPVAKDTTMFNNWNGQWSAARIGSSVTALLTSTLGAGLLLFLALIAMVHMFASTVLMALAPIMFLLAIHPSKGRRVFLSWAQIAVGSVFKYVISATIALIALLLYSTVISSTSGAMTFIGVLIITGVMVMYRKELTDLFGAVNMGGAKITNKVGEKFSGASDKLSNYANSLAGGAAGSVMAGGSATDGMKNAFGRELKRGRGLTAQAAREYSTTNRQIQAAEKQDKLLSEKGQGKYADNEVVENFFNDDNDNTSTGNTPTGDGNLDINVNAPGSNDILNMTGSLKESTGKGTDMNINALKRNQAPDLSELDDIEIDGDMFEANDEPTTGVSDDLKVNLQNKSHVNNTVDADGGDAPAPTVPEVETVTDITDDNKVDTSFINKVNKVSDNNETDIEIEIEEAIAPEVEDTPKTEKELANELRKLNEQIDTVEPVETLTEEQIKSELEDDDFLDDLL